MTPEPVKSSATKCDFARKTQRFSEIAFLLLTNAGNSRTDLLRLAASYQGSHIQTEMVSFLLRNSSIMFAHPHRLLPLLGETIPEDLGPTLDDLSPGEIRRALAIGLYAERRCGLQQSAQLAGLDRASFLQHLLAKKISIGHVPHGIAA